VVEDRNKFEENQISHYSFLISIYSIIKVCKKCKVYSKNFEFSEPGDSDASVEELTERGSLVLPNGRGRVNQR